MINFIAGVFFLFLSLNFIFYLGFKLGKVKGEKDTLENNRFYFEENGVKKYINLKGEIKNENCNK